MRGRKVFDEQQVIRSLLQGEPGGALGSLDELSRRRRVDWIIDQSFEEESAEDIPRWSQRSLAVAIAASTAFAMLIFIVGRALLREDAGSSKRAASIPTAPDGVPDQASRLVAADHDALHLISSGVWLLLEANSVARVRSTKQRISVHLETGMAWLDVNPRVKPAGLGVMVQVSRGDITAVGTVFGVQETPGYTEVTVLEGTVSITDRTPYTIWVTSGYKLRVGEYSAHPLDPEAVRIAWIRLRDQGMATDRDPTATVVEEKEAMPAELHRTSRHRVKKVSSITPHGLLKAARRYKNRGDYLAANKSLKKLIKRFPMSEEAPVALIAKARLALDRLALPKTALRLFNTYLASPRHSDLRAEALLGKARAQRRLGDNTGACETLKSIVRRYGRGLLADRARRRLRGCPN